jgi:hypothetical protein
MLRFTLAVIQQLLAQNEGFEDTTHSSGKNHSETRRYRIADGNLYIKESGKTSWANSRYDNEPRVATAEEARRFLKPRQDRLNTDGIE